MSNYELPLTISVSLQRGSEIRGAPNQQNRRRHLMEQALLYAMRSQSASCPPLQQAIVRRLHPLSSGKRGLVRKVEPSLMGKSDANECNESSLSNCRVQLTLSTKKDGMILERRLDDFRNQNPFSIQKDFQSPSAPHVTYPSRKD